jgi:RsiW-degrading membrane proteinase PrsW (M82 family)
MSHGSRLLLDATHSRRFLWRFALGTLACGIALGYAWHRWHPGPPPDLDARIMAALATGVDGGLGTPAVIDPSSIALETLARDLAATPRPFDEVLDLLPRLAHWAPAVQPAAINSLLSPHYTPEQSQLGAELFDALRDDDSAALERLRASAAASPPRRHAAHAAGLAYLSRRDFRTAHAYFAQEGRDPEATLSRHRAIDCLLAAQDFQRLRALESDPAYAALIDPVVRLQAAIHAKDWPAILRLVPRSQFTGLDPAITTLALVAGLAWAFFLVQLGQVARLDRGAGVLCVLALAAGVISTTPTIYAVIWQDDFLGFSEGDAIQTVLYCIGGIGVREEICKLALFVPFLPILLRRGDELEALVVASFVGLGFAMEENGNYFLSSEGTAAAGRFLTANFFHIVLTGMSGLALFRACARGWSGLNEFLTVFGAAIVAHGAYDALLSIPELEIGGYLAMAVYVMTCQYYFSRAHALRDPARATISLSGAFIGGIATLGAAMIVFQMVRLGPADGLMIVVPELIGTIVLLVMFFREFNEPLTT